MKVLKTLIFYRTSFFHISDGEILAIPRFWVCDIIELFKKSDDFSKAYIFQNII